MIQRDPFLSIHVAQLQNVVGASSVDAAEAALLKQLDPKDRERYQLQKRIQNKAEMAALLSQLQGLRHQTAMSVISNIR